MSRSVRHKPAPGNEHHSSSACGCSPESAVAKVERPAGRLNLSDLVPIAVVIAAGCEPCAERMVRRALEQGASPEHVGHVLRIVGSMQKLDCFAQALGTEAVMRMERPLRAAERTLQLAIVPTI